MQRAEEEGGGGECRRRRRLLGGAQARELTVREGHQKTPEESLLAHSGAILQDPHTQFTSRHVTITVTITSFLLPLSEKLGASSGVDTSVQYIAATQSVHTKVSTALETAYARAR